MAPRSRPDQSKQSERAGAGAEAPGTLRAQPQQKRSLAQVEAIERAARSVLQTVGRDRFTTGQVAAAAGVSIGTIYRYFPDKVAILDHVWPDRRDDKLPRGPSKSKG